MKAHLLFAAVAQLALSGAALAADYDVVIRNGRVLDGSGNPWVAADIAIANGRFVKIGRVEGRGTREIDARDAYVSPGWIDMMDQSGAALLRDGLAENKLRQGITTAIGGESGTPVGSAALPSYFGTLGKQGISLNFGSYYGATQARIEVMGDVAGQPSPAQLEQMKSHVEQAMKAGAMGIATALIYTPATFQSTDELVQLAQVAARYDGIYASHMRDESEKLLEAIRESIEIGERAGIDVEIFHFKAAYAPGWGKLVGEARTLIESARTRGVNIASDMYVYTAGGTGLEVTVPSWVWENGKKKGLERLKDPKLRSRLKAEFAADTPTPGWSNIVKASGGWQNVMLVNAYDPAFEKYRYKSLEYIGKQLNKDPADVAWDIVSGAQPNRAMALFFGMAESDIETALKWPWMSIGSDAAAVAPTDAGALLHPRTFGTFPRVIAEYVKKRGVISLEDAIRKMTSLPAARMHLFDRGAIREGLKADVTIFDYQEISDTATYEKPMSYPVGIDYVLVNGQLVIDQGRHTGARPGVVLRGAGYQGE
jgi:N-acyl-D-amino-acid deacylase